MSTQISASEETMVDTADVSVRSSPGQPNPLATLDRFAATPRGRVVLGSIGVGAALLVWQIAGAVGLLPTDEVADPLSVAGALVTATTEGWLWGAVTATVVGLATGLLIAVVVGVAIGVTMGSSRIVRRALSPIVEFFRPVPGVALIPLALLAFGQTTQSVVLLVAFGCVWPMLVQTLQGVLAIDPLAMQTARSYGLSYVPRIRRVAIPASLPYIATGVRMCASIALIVAVTVELVIGVPGLGNEIRKAQEGAEIEIMYALIIITGVFGLAIQSCLGLLERRLLRWHQSQRTVTG